MFARTEMSKRVIRFAVGPRLAFEASKSSHGTDTELIFSVMHAVIEAAQQSINSSSRYDRELTRCARSLAYRHFERNLADQAQPRR
jgi:hypothetical protein